MLAILRVMLGRTLGKLQGAAAVAILVVAGLAVLLSTWKLQQGHRWYQEQVQLMQGQQKALEAELNRTRAMVLLEQQRGAQELLGLSRAIQSEEVWSATEVPSSIREAIQSSSSSAPE